MAQTLSENMRAIIDSLREGWEDEEYQRRMDGTNRALSQDQHTAVNTKYPGTTLEYCSSCGDPTGKAGQGEDSLYTDEGEGPYCEDCFDKLDNNFDI